METDPLKQEQGTDKENVESAKLEWGPDLGPGKTYDEALAEIEKINSGLAEGEKPWRLPTLDELYEAASDETAGFKPEPYWSSTPADDGYDFAGRVMTKSGQHFGYYRHNNDPRTRLVR